MTTIRVKVSPGMFASERCVTFEVEGKQYCLLADERSVHGDMLEVFVVCENLTHTWIDLPNDTFAHGSRVKVPSSMIYHGPQL